MTTGLKIVRQYAFSLDSSSKELLIEIIDKALDAQIEACARVIDEQAAITDLCNTHGLARRIRAMKSTQHKERE